MSKVILSSGGMDTYLLAHLESMRDAVHVFVDVGHRYADHELQAAKVLAQYVDAPFHYVRGSNFAQYEHSSGIIPFRNAELILNAAQFGTKIYMGVIADEINSDKSIEFLEAMQEVLNISHRRQYWTEGKTFTLHTPLRAVTKAEAIREYLDKGNLLSTLLESVSCYSSTRHCGQCASCFKRWVALTVATRQDFSDHFAKHPGNYARSLDMRTYTDRRRSEIEDALRIAS